MASLGGKRGDLTDLRLPDMDGMEVVRGERKRPQPKSPSGTINILAGCDDAAVHYAKPFVGDD
jgi:CheY-like chemotaxis protein